MVIGTAHRCWTCGQAYTGCVGGQCPRCRLKEHEEQRERERREQEQHEERFPLRESDNE